MKEKYKLAGKVIELNSIHSYVHEMCSDYRSDEEPEIFVEITPADLEFEKKHTDRLNPAAYLETLAAYRKIAAALLDFNTILFHGSAVGVDGKAYLFTAKSGTGKSTHAANWRSLFGEKAVMINDDKPLIRIHEDSAEIFGTPWDGKHHLSTNTSMPLKAVCILERDETNHIEKIEPREAYAMIMQQSYRPSDAESIKKTLDLADKLVKVVELYKLGCNMEEESAEVAYNGMKG